MRFIDTNGRLIDVFICLPSQVPNVLAKLAKARIQVKKVGDEYQVKNKVRLLNLIRKIDDEIEFWTKLMLDRKRRSQLHYVFEYPLDVVDFKREMQKLTSNKTVFESNGKFYHARF